jgi:thioredoxin reductase
VQTQYDVIIVGGGPAGLSAGLLLGRCLRRTIVIDDDTPRNAATTAVHGFLTRDGIAPRELRELGRRELAAYGVDFLRDKVTQARRLTDCDSAGPTAFEIALQGGQVLRCRKLLLATGMADDVPEIPGARECYGVSVHHCPYCDGWEHRGKRLAAIGRSANAAAGLGLALATWSSQTIVFTNGDELTDDCRQQLDQRHITTIEQPAAAIEHRNGNLTGVRLVSGESVPADALFFNTRQEQQSALMAALGCEFEVTDSATHARTGKRQRTRVPGLFLAGDADGEVEFAIVAAAEGAVAATTINRELQDEGVRPALAVGTADESRG